MGRAAPQRTESRSPDGKSVAFIRDWNLWVRDVATGRETQLTTDGVKDFGYATDNAGWTRSDRPILRVVAGLEEDRDLPAGSARRRRDVPRRHRRSAIPTLQAWKYPLPGDAIVTMIQRVVIDVDEPAKSCASRCRPISIARRCATTSRAAARMGRRAVEPGRQRRSRSCRPSRDHRHEQLRVADAATGAIRDVLEEKAETFFESGNGRVNWRYLPAIERGDLVFRARQLGPSVSARPADRPREERDHQRRRQRHAAAARRREEPACCTSSRVGQGTRAAIRTSVTSIAIGMDGKQPAAADAGGRRSRRHAVAVGRFFVDSYSKPDVPPVAELRDADGKLVLPLEKADISQAAGDRLEAADADHASRRATASTDLYGLMYKPTNLDPAKKYPIVNHIYPGPQTGSVGGRTFSPARGDAQALAELGFVVVEIDGMGTPWRSKKFHEAYYGNMGDNTLPDQVAGMKQLAARYPVDRHRSRRHLRPLGRRLRDGRRDVPLSRTSSRSAFRRRATTTTASTRTTGPRSGRACSRPTPTARPTTTTRRISWSRRT